MSELTKPAPTDIEQLERTILGAVMRVARWKHNHPPVRNVNKEFEASFTPLERVAVAITDRVGSFGFFLIILGWSILWLGWNCLAPRSVRFDPAPAFVMWLFISNMIQILLMPLIMVGQNLQGRHAELRAQSDFEINIKAEKEVAEILRHLEQQSAEIERQGQIALEILQRLEGASAGPAQPATGG